MYQQYKQLDNLCNATLTKEDKENIVGLSVDQRWKSVEKLLDALLLDLQNKTFREAQNVNEIFGVKWTRTYIQVFRSQIKHFYTQLTKSYAKKPKETPSTESFSQVPETISEITT